MISTAEDGIRYGRSTLLRKKPPAGRMRLSSTDSAKDKTHRSGAQIMDRIIVFLRPSRNIWLFQTLI